MSGGLVPDGPTPLEALDRVRASVISAMHEGPGGVEPLACVARACVELLPVDGASVSVISSTQNREMLYASDEVSTRIEALQFGLGEGPCFEAFDTRSPVLVPDLPAAAAQSWPVFATEAAELPIGAIFAFPLLSGVIGIGALDLYRREPGWLSPAQVTTALHLVDITALALLEMRTIGIDGQWSSVLKRRQQVHQATGMLIAAHGIQAANALALLRSFAFSHGRTINDVAADIVTRRLPATDVET